MLEVIFITNGVRTTLHSSNNFSVITEEENAVGKLECTLYPTDESFNNVFPRITDVIAYDTFSNEVVFEGHVYSVNPSMDNSKITAKVTCVHILSELTTSCVVGFEAYGDLKTMVGMILDVHNAQAPEKHRIYMGTGPSGGHPEVVHMAYNTCLDAIIQLVVTDAGWSFKPRYSDGRWYLDVAPEFGEYSKDNIIVGVNMLSISKTVDESELFTRIIPIGGASYIPADYRNPQMSMMHDVGEGMPLNLYKYWTADPYHIYVANSTLERKYPPLAKIVQYDDIVATDETDFRSARQRLLARGEADAAALTDIIEEYEVTALDLSRAGYDYDEIKMYDMYHVMNNKLDINTYLRVVSRKVNYSEPYKSELTFGAVTKSAMRFLSRTAKSTDQKISEVGAASYNTTNTRLGGMSLRNTTSDDYSGSTHDANTLYTVSDAATGKVELYLGDTKISGEEGGGVSVAYAALLNDNNFADFIVTTELMLNISAHTNLYYGALPSFGVVQGKYCLFYNGTLAEGTELFNDIIVHRSYFGQAYGNYSAGDYDGFIFYGRGSHGLSNYVSNFTGFLMVGSLSRSSASIYRETLWLEVREYYRGCDPTDPIPVVDPTTYTQTRDVSAYIRENGSYDISATADDWFILPVFGSITADTNEGYRSTPYGYATGLVYYVLYSQGGDWHISDYWRITAGTSAVVCPLASQAELAFNLGVSQRSEPVTSNGGD